MSGFGVLNKAADKTWRSILRIFSAVAMVLSLVLLYPVLSLFGGDVNSNTFKYLYEQFFVATILITGLMAAGNYLSKRSKLPSPPDTNAKVSILQKEIDLSPFIKYLFVFLLGICASSYFLYKRISFSSSIILNHEQISELKKFTYLPVVSYYFDVNKYDSITNVTFYTGEREQHKYPDDLRQIVKLFLRAEAKPEAIVIYGYADDTGKDVDNLVLSRRRAEFVRGHFIDADFTGQMQMNVVNGGVIMNSCNTATADREKCLANSRRVDVYFVGYVPRTERKINEQLKESVTNENQY